MNKNMLDNILTCLTNPEKCDLDDVFLRWSRSIYGQRVVKNIESERFLPDNLLESLVRFIISKKSEPIEVVENEYQNECWKPMYIRKGGQVNWNGKKPKFFGTAIEIDTFTKHLMDNYGSTFPSQKDAVKFIDRLKLGTLSRLKKNINLKMYSVWTTWNESDTDSIPYEFCNTDEANEIRANMGLDKRYVSVSNEILIFIYKINPDEVQRPTITDAGLNQYFEPPPRAMNNHGFTRNWEMEKRFDHYNLKARPEGIHDKIKLSSLALPIKSRI